MILVSLMLFYFLQLPTAHSYSKTCLMPQIELSLH